MWVTSYDLHTVLVLHLLTRADYHFNDLLKLPEEFDVYAGIDLGVAFYGDYKSKMTIIEMG